MIHFLTFTESISTSPDILDFGEAICDTFQGDAKKL